jgi:hypothetical protein
VDDEHNTSFDLEQIRLYRSTDAAPPSGLQGRIEARLLEAMLDEQAQQRDGVRTSRSPRRRHFFDGLLKPALVGGVAVVAALLVAVVSDGSSPDQASLSTGAVRTAGFDSTAARLFSPQGEATQTQAPIGRIDLTEATGAVDALASGPTSQTALNDATKLPTQPAALAAALREAAAQIDNDPNDRVAFHIGMSWVSSPRVPNHIRSHMLRAIGALNNVDPAASGSDLMGRVGVVIGHHHEATGVREQYLLDPNGGSLLERRGYVTSYVDPACTPGTYTDHAIFENGLEIDPASAQWLAWPVEVEACAP